MEPHVDQTSQYCRTLQFIERCRRRIQENLYYSSPKRRGSPNTNYVKVICICVRVVTFFCVYLSPMAVTVRCNCPLGMQQQFCPTYYSPQIAMSEMSKLSIRLLQLLKKCNASPSFYDDFMKWAKQGVSTGAFSQDNIHLSNRPTSALYHCPQINNRRLG